MKTSKINCTGASDGKKIEHLLTQAQNLPKELRKSGHFCVWRYERIRDRWAKVPYNPLTGCRADSSDINTFCSFEEAAETLHSGGYNGLGVGIFGTLAAIDIDHCIVNGNYSAMAQDIIDTMDAYTEHSPSEEGIRILFLVNHFEYDTKRYYINNRSRGLEVYVAGATKKYVTVTGDASQMWKMDLMERGEQLKIVLERYMVRPTPENAAMALPHPGGAELAPGGRARFSTPVQLSDDEVLEKAFASKNGEQFRALYNGDISGYQSQSEADLALCNQLAFWCGRDSAQMDMLFRKSGLMRDKWDRQQSGSTYGAITLMKASQSCQNVYAPALCAPSYPLDGLEPPPERGFAPLEQGLMETPPLDGLEPSERSFDAMENPSQAPAEAPRQWRIPENIPRFDPVDARTLQGMDIKPLRFVVQGLLPEGLSMLASPPKYGKSWMMLDLGICVASGQPFLGRSTQSGQVLYLALEDGNRRLQERTNCLLASETAPANLDLQIRARTLDDGLLEQMHQYMLDKPDTVLIIIDTLKSAKCVKSPVFPGLVTTIGVPMNRHVSAMKMQTGKILS